MNDLACVDYMQCACMHVFLKIKICHYNRIVGVSELSGGDNNCNLCHKYSF